MLFSLFLHETGIVGPHLGGSNEYLRSMFYRKKRKKYTPVIPSFTTHIYKWVVRGGLLHGSVIMMDMC